MLSQRSACQLSERHTDLTATKRPPLSLSQQAVSQSAASQWDRARQRVLWHGLWGICFLAIAVSLYFAGGPLRMVVALAVTALPALAVIGLAAHNEAKTPWPQRAPSTPWWTMGLWVVAPVAASIIAGGLSSPLAAIVFAPVAGGLALRSTGEERPLLAGLAGVAVGALLGAVAGFMWPAIAPMVLLSGVLGVSVAAFALVAAYNTRNTLPLVPLALARMESALADQPGLTLVLTPAGKALAAYGAAPPAIEIDSLFTEAEAQGGLIGAVYPPDRPAVRAALSRAQAGLASQVRFTPRGALDRRVLLIVRRMQGDDSRRLAALMLDATLQHAREAELDAARGEAESAAQARARFIAHMSHELRTPLNAVLGFSDVMRQKLFGPLPDRYADYASSIHQAGSHLLDMISDVLDVSRIDADRYELETENIDARDIADAALALVRMQAEDKAIQLVSSLPEEPLLLTADGRAMKQILVNLLGNAVKFTPNGGQVLLGATIHANHLEVTVSDNGVGISPDDLARLGKPFEQAGDATQKAMGSGLGLSLARSLAELHGGKLTLESTLGHGTTAHLTLPLKPE